MGFLFLRLALSGDLWQREAPLERGIGGFNWSLQRLVEPYLYVSIRYTERLADAGLEPSVGSIGDSYDNALAETINGLYKAELIRHRGPGPTLEAVEFATLEWGHWYNHHRIMETIGNRPPAEAEATYYQQLNEQAEAA